MRRAREMGRSSCGPPRSVSRAPAQHRAERRSPPRSRRRDRAALDSHGATRQRAMPLLQLTVTPTVLQWILATIACEAAGASRSVSVLPNQPPASGARAPAASPSARQWLSPRERSLPTAQYRQETGVPCGPIASTWPTRYEMGRVDHHRSSSTMSLSTFRVQRG